MLLKKHDLNERDLKAAKKAVDSIAAASASEEGLMKTYAHPHLAQLLPYRLPPECENAMWRRSSGGVTLEVVPGTKLNEVGERVNVGSPAGTRARLLMSYTETQAVVTQRPEIDYGKPLAAFLSRMNLDSDKKSLALFLQQAEKVVRSTMTLSDATGNRVIFNSDTAEPAFLKDGYARTLNPIYFQELMERALPLPEYAIQALARSSKKLDCLAWLAATLPFLEKALFVSWDDLSCRFGYEYSGFKAGSNFRRDFTAVLKAVTLQYVAAKVDLDPDQKGVILYPSNPPVPPAARVSGHRF